MSESFDINSIDVPNMPLKQLHTEAYQRGFDEEALKRFHFRMNWVEEKINERKKILSNGNIASLAQEMFVALYLVQDFLDAVREAMTLNFRQEQGLATPPNPVASGTETGALS